MKLLILPLITITLFIGCASTNNNIQEPTITSTTIIQAEENCDSEGL